MIVYAEEILTVDLEEELTPILEAHREELVLYPEMQLNVNWEAYYVMQNAALLKLYTVRDGSRLVGYASYFVHNNLHYQDYKQAVCDAIYVSKGKRGAYIGSKLIDYADKALLTSGVQFVFHHVKLKHDFSPLLERKGYIKVETMLTKRLG